MEKVFHTQEVSHIHGDGICLNCHAPELGDWLTGLLIFLFLVTLFRLRRKGKKNHPS